MMEIATVFSPGYEKTAIFTAFHGVVMEIAMVFSPRHESCHFHGISRPNLFPRPYVVSTAICGDFHGQMAKRHSSLFFGDLMVPPGTQRYAALRGPHALATQRYAALRSPHAELRSATQHSAA